MRDPMTFVCVAEAIAHFYKLGYTSTCHRTGERVVMFKPGNDQLLCPMIEINKTGFLTVEAKEI